MHPLAVKKRIAIGIAIACGALAIIAAPFLFSAAQNIFADNSVAMPTLQGTWIAGANIVYGGDNFRALNANGSFLRTSLLDKDSPKSYDDAVALAKNYGNSSTFTSVEKADFQSGNGMRLPLKSEVSGKLSQMPYAGSPNDWWWLGDDLNVPGQEQLVPMDSLGDLKVPVAYVVNGQNLLDQNVNGKQDATGKQILPPYTSYSCGLQTGATESDRGMVPNGCHTLNVNGVFPIVPFTYDAGYLYEYQPFNGTPYQQETYITPINGGSYYFQSWVSQSESTARQCEFNATLTDIKNKQYTIPGSCMIDYAKYFEYENRFPKPPMEKTSGYFKIAASNFLFQSMTPLKVGDTIPANTRIVAFPVTKDNNNPSSTKRFGIPKYYTFAQPMTVVSNPYGNTVRTTATDQPLKRHITQLPPAGLQNITPAKAATRPLMTLDQSKVAFFELASNGASVSLSNNLIDAPLTNITDGNTYKAVMKDDTKNVSDVQAVGKGIIKYDSDSHTLYVRPGTSMLNLNVTTPSYTSNSYVTVAGVTPGGTTELARLSAVNSTTTAVNFELGSVISNLNTLGSEANLSFFLEQRNGPNKSNYISGTPFNVKVKVTLPQKVNLDQATENLKDVTYGEDVTLSARMDASIAPTWSSDPITFSIDTSDPGDAQGAEIISDTNSWNAASGVAKVKLHLKDGAGGSDGKISIVVSKSGGANGAYMPADTQRITLNVHKRAITITPRLMVMQTGEAYPPTDWKYTVRYNEDASRPGLVNGDTMPYSFVTKDIGDGASPVLTNGVIANLNNGKNYGINLVPKSDDVMAAFNKKYDTTLHDYDHGNQASKLEIKYRVNPITQADIVAQPVSIEQQGLGDKISFSFDVKIPTMSSDGTHAVSPEDQNLQMTWYVSKGGGPFKEFEPSPGHSVTVTYTDADATHRHAIATLTIDSVADIDNMSAYYCDVSNASNDDPISSHTATLGIIQEPYTYVQIPTDEVQLKNNGQSQVTNTKKDSLYVSLSNVPSGTYAPQGTFRISTKKIVRLYYEHETNTTDIRKYYVMKVLKPGGDPSNPADFVGDDGQLMDLSYHEDGKQKQYFNIVGKQDLSKLWGTYSGTMSYTLKYIPPSQAP